MQLYPANTLTKFEFDLILDLIEEQCVSTMGKAFSQNLLPSTSLPHIANALAITKEFMEISLQQLSFPVDGYLYLSPFLSLFKIDNFTGDLQHFRDIRTVVKAIASVKKFLKNQEEENEVEYALIKSLVNSSPYEKSISQVIDEVLSTNGTIKDKASQVLFIIRQEKSKTARELEKVFNQALSQYRKLKYLADIQETVSNGRRVLAVKAEYKRKIKGVVHDISESGQTAYIEPNSALQLSNELVNLEQDERTEIQRILRELTARVRPHVPLLYQYESILQQLDFARAKAVVAGKMNANIPNVQQNPIIELAKARHPILYLQNKKSGKDTIPLEVKLNKDQRIIVISGPNAGGKSVALKTIGLLQLMIQSGIPIPVEEDSTIGIFSHLLTEIGDEQSIENELSTYSSKLKHMEFFLRTANKNTLFLIDEFGSGTDPSLGGAVAQAILETLNKRKAFGVVTTHYLNLKTFASDADGVKNAAMLFNEHNLSPLYQLETGKPGSSYTFAIAKTSGLPEKLVNRARNISSNSQVELDELLTETQQSQSELVLEKLELENKKRELLKAEKELEQLRKKLKTQQQGYNINKREAELQIKSEVKKQVDVYIKKIEAVENKQKAAQQVREKLRNEVQTTQGLLRKNKRAKAKNEQNILKKKLSVGDRVKWINTGKTGELIEIKNKKGEVAFGQMRTTVSLTDLLPIDEPLTPKKQSVSVKKPQPKSIQFEIDIRGMRVDEAERELNSFFDQAILANSTWLRVVHGKGSGALRDLTRKVAQQYRASDISHPHFDEGGDGASIVKFTS